MKVPKACGQCRQSKRRCIRAGPGRPCDTCHHRHLQCDGDLTHRRNGHPRRVVAEESREDSQGPERSPHLHASRGEVELPPGLAIELVEHYLDKIHDRPHSLFHPNTLRSQVQDETLSKQVLYAICALGTKFSANPDARSLGDQLATESKQLLKTDLENVCLENIQTCFLIATLNVGTGNSSSETIFFRIATTMSDIMRLNQPAPVEIDLIERETRRRVWWSLYMADLWCISGLGLPNHMNNVSIKIEEPMDEGMFARLIPKETLLNNPWKAGLWAHMTRLVENFGPIQHLNRRVVKGSLLKTDLYWEVGRLAEKLQDWSDTLPEDAKMDDPNLLKQQQQGLGGLLISIHLAYHHFSTLLYFGFLDTRKSPSTIDGTYLTRCKWHASCFSDLIRKSRQLKGCEAVYPLVGHMTTVSSSVLVHTLLFGEIDELDTARQELNSNFEALIELKQYWPATENWVKRLVMFQNECFLAASRAHRLDGWMLRILIEHELPLNADRGLEDINVHPASERRVSEVRRLMNQ